ncbi:MAG TPA: hypothetical protein VJZ27_11085, partial [Aggregatilineales bacterium]|nr:hypothetical protein [Aggregatilineales bacterium]
MNQKNFFWIALVMSVLLMLPLTAVFYLAQNAIDVPFPAFDLMDFAIRTLPGDVVTFGIENMSEALVKTGIGDGDDLDNTAKLSEQAIAILQFIGIGTLLGFVYALVVYG